MTTPNPSSLPRWSVRIALAISVVMVLALLLVRGMTFSAAADWGSTAPLWAQAVIETVAQYGLLALIALYGLGLLRARSRGLHRLSTGLAAGAGVVLAYLCSELVKVVVSELRPCLNFDIATIASCPARTDWAWPSNHGTLSGAITVAVIAMVPRLWPGATALAVAIATCRVFVGVHYFHDVVAGLALGAVVVALSVRWAGPGMAKLVIRAAASSAPIRWIVGAGPPRSPGAGRTSQPRPTASS